MDKRTVAEIHKERVSMWDQSILNHKKYISTETGMFDSQFVEDRNCPVCNSHNERKLFTKEGGQYVKCNDCDMVYLNPVFTDEALTKYYMSNHDEQSKTTEGDMSFYSNLYNKGLDEVEKSTKPGKILDIGCSSGLFLDISRERGWETYGLELNQTEIEYSRSKGHTVFNFMIAELVEKEDIKFDAITMWDVFEHVKDGRALLENVKKLLTDDGVFFIQVPSADSLAARVMQKDCNMFDGLEHVNLYASSTIDKLVDSVGMKVQSVCSVISEIGVMNNYLSYDDPYMGKTQEKHSLIGALDEDYILKNLIGYKLQVVIKQIKEEGQH